MPKANLFVVGLPKTGTTSLYHYFKSHPDIFVPEQKELDHFNKDFHNEILNHTGSIPKSYKTDIEDYKSMFCANKEYKYYADISPQYAHSKLAAKEINKFNPEAKIIIIFREPVSFLQSLHSQYLYATYENVKDFHSAFELSESRKQGKKIPSSLIRPSMLFYNELINYKDILKHYIDWFPKKNIKVLFYDDLQTSPYAFMNNIFSFLNISLLSNNNYTKHNPRKFHRSQFIKNFINNKPIKRMVHKYISKNTRERFNNFYAKHFVKESKKPAYLHELKGRFTSNVKDFEKYINDTGILGQEIPLMKKWGY